MEPIRDDPGMRAIARLWARLDAYRRDELVQLLSPEALDDLHPVQRLMADPEGPVQTRALALSAVTWFHWCRYHLLTGEPAERELRMALAAGAQAAASPLTWCHRTHWPWCAAARSWRTPRSTRTARNAG